MKKSGSILGQYTITQTLHKDGGSIFYLGLRKGMGGFTQQVVIQHICMTSKERTEQILANARTSGLLSHTNIIQLLDIKQDEDGWYIAMEYINGTNLRHLIQSCNERRRLIPIPQALYITLEILNALNYSHARGIRRGNHRQNITVTHNNLKPENILIDMQGGIKLSGFSKDFPPVQRHSFHPAEPNLDIRSDIYSVAALLCFMMTGKSPQELSTPLPEDAETAHSYSLVTPELLKRARPEVDSALVLIIIQALSLQPSGRFQSAAAFKEALQKHIDSSILLTSSIALSSLLLELYQSTKSGEDEIQTMVSKTQPMSDILDLPIEILPESEPSTIAQFVKANSTIPIPTPPKNKLSNAGDKTRPQKVRAQVSSPPVIIEPEFDTAIFHRLVIGFLWIISVLFSLFFGYQLAPNAPSILPKAPQIQVFFDKDSTVKHNGIPIPNSGSTIEVEGSIEQVLVLEKGTINTLVTIPPVRMNEIRYIDLRQATSSKPLNPKDIE